MALGKFLVHPAGQSATLTPSSYPVHLLIRDKHRKRDFVLTYSPLVTNDEVLFTDPTDFGYYCDLLNLGLLEAVHGYVIVIRSITTQLQPL